MSLRSTADKKGFFWHVVPALLYAIFIFWLGSIHTTLSIPQDFIARDKLNHFVAFGVLTVLTLRALRFEMDTAALRVLITASIGISSITGALLELWQSCCHIERRNSPIGSPIRLAPCWPGCCAFCGFVGVDGTWLRVDSFDDCAKVHCHHRHERCPG